MFGSLASQIIAFTILATLIYACCIADPNTSNVARFFNRTIPTWILRNIERGSLKLVYLLVVLGSWSIVFIYGYPAIDNSQHIDSWHKYSGYGLFWLCTTTWLYASNRSPGDVTEKTIPLFDHYEYDNVLYTQRLCPTLKIRKIARSKYDKYTKKHVPRFDHFCGWLNQAIGEQNYRWFLLFLSVHIFTCAYGSWAMTTLLYGEVVDKDLMNSTFHNEVLCSFFQCGGDERVASYVVIFHYLFRKNPQIVGVLLVMVFVVGCLVVFLGFHLYITSQNMTTNEYYKWKKIRKRSYKNENQVFKNGANIRGQENCIKRASIVSDESKVDFSSTKPVKNDAVSGLEPGAEVYDTSHFANIYDKGTLRNFLEILYPLSYRNEAITRQSTFMQENASQRQRNSSKPKYKGT